MKKARNCRAPQFGHITINVPSDLGARAERALMQLQTCEAACLWCGHGYRQYNVDAQDEHFAYNCPEAPQALREEAKRRLSMGDQPPAAIGRTN